MDFQIETQRLRLIACDESVFEAIFESDEALAKYLDIIITESAFEFGDAPIRSAYDKIIDNPAEKTWWMYLVIHKNDKKLIGTCGYKGLPNEEGEVEIGYGIMEGYRNQGYATELSKALIDRAFDQSNVVSVLAHTLAEENASVKVLKKCQMQFVKELIDKEDGKIWKWHINKDL